MAFHQVFACDHPVKNPMVCISNIGELGIKENIFKCCANANFSRKIVFYVENEEDDGEPDDVFQNIDMILVFSPRLIKALNDANITGIQYIPIDVVNYQKKKIDGFCIANVLDNIDDAFIYEKSLCQHYTDEDDEELRGKIDFIWRYAIDSNKAAGHDIFRLKFDERFDRLYSKILVSEKFKTIFTKNKFTGYSFSKIIAV